MGNQQHTHGIDGGAFGEILQGCATCCDGTLRAAESSNADQEVKRLIEQARDLCRQAADRVKATANQ
jgi:hypothetical protein